MSLVTRNLLKLSTKSIINSIGIRCIGNSGFSYKGSQIMNFSQNIIPSRKFGAHAEHKASDHGEHHEEHHDDHHEAPHPKSQFKFSRAEVARHNTKKDCWVIIDNKVYNLTEFWENAPCGRFRIVYRAGTDATGAFEASFHPSKVRKYMERYYIGDVIEKMDKERASAITMEQAESV